VLVWDRVRRALGQRAAGRYGGGDVADVAETCARQMGADAAKRILLVDDDEVVLLVLRDSLAVLGDYDVVTAPSAQDGLGALEKQEFDLVITDLHLPGLSGVEFTEELRRRNERLPVIWVTAYGCHTVQERSAELQVYCCMDKPVEISEIRDVVWRVLNDHARQS